MTTSINVTELMSWLASDKVALNTTIKFEDVLKFHFYAKIPNDSQRIKIVKQAIKNLAEQGYISVDTNNDTITKKYFIDPTTYGGQLPLRKDN